MSRLIRLPEVVRLTGVSTSTVRDWVGPRRGDCLAELAATCDAAPEHEDTAHEHRRRSGVLLPSPGSVSVISERQLRLRVDLNCAGRRSYFGEQLGLGDVSGGTVSISHARIARLPIEPAKSRDCAASRLAANSSVSPHDKLTYWEWQMETLCDIMEWVKIIAFGASMLGLRQAVRFFGLAHRDVATLRREATGVIMNLQCAWWAVLASLPWTKIEKVVSSAVAEGAGRSGSPLQAELTRAGLLTIGATNIAMWSATISFVATVCVAILRGFAGVCGGQ